MPEREADAGLFGMCAQPVHDANAEGENVMASHVDHSPVITFVLYRGPTGLSERLVRWCPFGSGLGVAPVGGAFLGDSAAHEVDGGDADHGG